MTMLSILGTIGRYLHWLIHLLAPVSSMQRGVVEELPSTIALADGRWAADERGINLFSACWSIRRCLYCCLRCAPGRPDVVASIGVWCDAPIAGSDVTGVARRLCRGNPVEHYSRLVYGLQLLVTGVQRTWRTLCDPFPHSNGLYH